jgi:hypothetical protein
MEQYQSCSVMFLHNKKDELDAQAKDAANRQMPLSIHSSVLATKQSILISIHGSCQWF